MSAAVKSSRERLSKTKTVQSPTAPTITNLPRRPNALSEAIRKAAHDNAGRPESQTGIRGQAVPALRPASINDFSYVPSRGIANDYAAFFEQANLQPEEARQFIAIIAEERASDRDINELSKTTGLSSDEKIKLLSELLAQTRQNLATVLPESKLAIYCEYRTCLPYRSLVETASMICPKGESISAETQEAVIATLRKTKAFTPWTSTVREKQNLSQGDDLACAAVANLLTPNQLGAIRITLDEWRTMAEKQKLAAPEKQ